MAIRFAPNAVILESAIVLESLLQESLIMVFSVWSVDSIIFNIYLCSEMIDLKKRFGKKYRIYMDETWEAEDSQSNSDKVKDKPWYYEIRGKYGTVYLYGVNKLAVRITGNRIKSRIKVEYTDILSLYIEAEGRKYLFF